MSASTRTLRSTSRRRVVKVKSSGEPTLLRQSLHIGRTAAGAEP
jgi:hypothetical protein